MSNPSIFKISPGLQSYDWGKVGKSSLAAQFGQVCIPDFEAKEGEKYAELWMGTHVTLPSHLSSSPSTLLSSHLAPQSSSSSSPAFFPEAILKKFPNTQKGELPFLFKVLSIQKALSIQAHPDRELAERLFRERGDVYKDPNHKPEMAIALTPFRGFCGFLPLPLLLLLLSTIPELRSLIGEEALQTLAKSLDLPLIEIKDGEASGLGGFEDLVGLAGKCVDKGLKTDDVKDTTPTQKSALKNIFKILMSAPPYQITSTLSTLLTRYSSPHAATTCATKYEADLIPLVKELEEQYPGDVGVLCCFLLNVVELGVGEAVFLGADEPHAYISGDIIECMATSDNVVRAGLTPKLRDVPTLISMLTYTSYPSHLQLLTPTPFSPHTKLYDPPIEEFSVALLELAAGEKDKHRPVEGPSLCIVTVGVGRLGGEEVRRGEVVFVGSGVEVEFEAGGEGEGLTVFRAFVEA